jgi:hypothetical protein
VNIRKIPLNSRKITDTNESQIKKKILSSYVGKEKGKVRDTDTSRYVILSRQENLELILYDSLNKLLVSKKGTAMQNFGFH